VRGFDEKKKKNSPKKIEVFMKEPHFIGRCDFPILSKKLQVGYTYLSPDPKRTRDAQSKKKARTNHLQETASVNQELPGIQRKKHRHVA